MRGSRADHAAISSGEILGRLGFQIRTHRTVSSCYPAMALSISIANSIPDTDSPISLVVARSAMLEKLRPLDKRSINLETAAKGM